MTTCTKERMNWSLMIVGILLVLASALLGPSCAATWKRDAWKTVYAVRQAGEAADVALASACREKNKQCKLGNDYSRCIDKCAKALSAWTRYGRPSIDSAVILAVQALVLADKGVANKRDVFGAVQAAGCALLHAVEPWSGIVPKRAMEPIKRLSALVCKKGGA